jgi:hypothetical protein
MSFQPKTHATATGSACDAKISEKDKRNCPTDVPKTFALTIKSSIMPLANGSVGPPKEVD